MAEEDHKKTHPEKWFVCVDTGGTFTDCVAINPLGEEKRVKVLSNGGLRARILGYDERGTLRTDFSLDLPQDFFDSWRVVLNGESLEGCAIQSYQKGVFTLSTPQRVNEGDLLEVVSPEEAPIVALRLLTGVSLGGRFPAVIMRLATTRGTNALLENKGAPVTLFVTKGFRDLLAIRDQKRPDIFALNVRKPAPLTTDIREVEERLDKNGNVLEELSLDDLDTEGIQAAAVALLHSYRNDEHEQKIIRLLKDRGVPYAVSSTTLSRSIKYLLRMETAVVDASLGPIMTAYFNSVNESLGEGSQLAIMTSAGGLVSLESYAPKDSLLSGPAGGVVGAVQSALRAGEERAIAFDMGGTSTDVSRFDGWYEYNRSHSVGTARLLAPALKIETVAAGGGSVCDFEDGFFKVGPKSGGAFPGPACYGAGGPLTITDINLLAGHLDSKRFGIPVYPEKAEERLEELRAKLPTDRQTLSQGELIGSFLDIANERMADAIRLISVREGYEPSEYPLVAFGGAGGMHACAVAKILGMKTILFPPDSGLLSAFGLQRARLETSCERELLVPFSKGVETLQTHFEELKSIASQQLVKDGVLEEKQVLLQQKVEIRLKSQENGFLIDWGEGDIRSIFEERFYEVFGYHLLESTELEIARVSLRMGEQQDEPTKEVFDRRDIPDATETVKALVESNWQDIQSYNREDLAAGASIEGPALLTDRFSTLYIEKGWQGIVGSYGTVRLESQIKTGQINFDAPAQRELLTNRLSGIVEEMGHQLQRTALSTNIKERLDYSCALLDAEGRLLVNAPHIPVHLGALGECVRRIALELEMNEGDVIVTNHPAFGGSHLPDITVISPVWYEGKLVAYVANRAHHAEIGGILPGSMPPGAKSLAEEGVVISPTYIVHRGKDNWTAIGKLLSEGRYPSRSVSENIADLHAQVASNRKGISALIALFQSVEAERMKTHFDFLLKLSEELVTEKLEGLLSANRRSMQYLDDGSQIAVTIKRNGKRVIFDFAGTSGTHSENLNATPAIVRSAVIYCLRLLIEKNLPLNEGILENIEIKIPEGTFLNPHFDDDAEKCPAVVGGNVEVSQRLVDTLLDALDVCACSQGTMNNTVFGNDRFGYYETICGGAGAGPGWHGADAVHTHMTNTAITDPEILEHRYPVRLREFSIRNGSGGAGEYNGGDGVVRELEFLEPVSISFLTQHRKIGPYGKKGGSAGTIGRQTLRKAGSNVTEKLASLSSRQLEKGDIIRIETPGGGGWGGNGSS